MNRSPALLLTALATLTFGLAGCDGTGADVEDEMEVTRELESVERVDPEADVEVMPSGEVDVQLDPEVDSN